LSGSSELNVIKLGLSIGSILGVSSSDISGLGSLKSLLSLNNVGSLGNVSLESRSGFSWSPLSLLLLLGEGVVWVMMVVVMVVRDSRGASEKGDKNNGVFHFIDYNYFNTFL